MTVCVMAAVFVTGVGKTFPESILAGLTAPGWIVAMHLFFAASDTKVTSVSSEVVFWLVNTVFWFVVIWASFLGWSRLSKRRGIETRVKRA